MGITRHEISEAYVPNKKYWPVCVNLVVSTNEIWATVLDKSVSAFPYLMDEMVTYYNNNLSKMKRTTPECGEYYAVNKHGLWHRVYCKDVDGKTALFYIDCGITEFYANQIVYHLPYDFRMQTAQALRLSFSGLEDARDCDDIVSYIKKLIFDRTLHVETVRRDKVENESVICVEFYDTPEEKEDINLNLQVIDYVLGTIAIGPTLSTVGQLHEVTVTHVANDDVYVVINTRSSDFLSRILNGLINKIKESTRKACVVTRAEPSKIYLISSNGYWYRAQVLNVNSNNQVTVLLIDVGDIFLATASDLLDLGLLSKLLAKYPGQAKKVHVPDISKDLLLEFVLTKEVKVMKINSLKDGIPCVTLFEPIARKRPKQMLGRKTKTINGVITTLEPPLLPNTNEYFEILVVDVSAPDNFIIQPLSSQFSFRMLMSDLQTACNTYEGPELDEDSIKQGQIYAGRNSDNTWYRVRVLSMLGPYAITVELCDYGNTLTLSLSDLQPLKDKFVELPVQAIKAKCAGIAPVKGNWTTEDISRFKELVMERSFITVVDSFCHGEVIELKLMNVITSEDIYVNEILIQEGRAKKFW